MLRPRVGLRILCSVIGLAVVLWPLLARSQPEPAPVSFERGFRETVQPFLKTYCTPCHSGDKPKAELDLSAFTSADAVAKDLRRWETVLEQLEGSRMPPGKAKEHPPAALRQQVIAWIREVRKHEAKRNAGDPGPVPARG